MFYPSFGTKQVEIFLFIKLKSAILIQNDLMNNFHRLGVLAKPLDGTERLRLMHGMLNMDNQLGKISLNLSAFKQVM